jgi:hypothetical protein
VELLESVSTATKGVSEAEKGLPSLKKVTMMADWIDQKVDERQPAFQSLAVEQQYK